MPASTPNPDEVELHLKQILSSPQFASAGKAANLLRYLVDQYLAGLAPKETTIAVEIFGLASGYDPQSNSRVRISVARLRKRLAEYYGSNPHLALRIEIPVGAYAIEIVRAYSNPEPTAAAVEPPPLQPAPPIPQKRWPKYATWALGFLAVTALSLLSFRSTFSNTIPLPPDLQTIEAWELKISPDGAYIAAAMQDRLRVIHLESGQRFEFSLPGETTSALNWTADSNGLVWCGWDEDGKLVTWKLDRNGAKGQQLPDGFAKATLSPDNRWIAGWLPADRSVQIKSLIDPDEKRLVLLTNTSENFGDIEWTPDGTGAIWSANLADETCRFRFLGVDGRYAELFQSKGDCKPRGIRSDGMMLWVQNIYPTAGNAFTTPLDLSWSRTVGESKMVYTGRQTLRASWDAKGSKVLAATGKAMPEIAIAFLENDGKLRKSRLTHDPRQKYPSQAALDSNGLFYEMEATPGVNQIFYQSLDGSTPKQITFGANNSYYPRLSPDRNWLLFVTTPPRDSPGGPEMPDRGGIFRLPMASLKQPQPGPISKVSTKGPFGKVGCAKDPGSRCVTDYLDHNYLVVQEFDPVAGPGRDLVRIEMPPGVTASRSLMSWTISHDGNTIAVFSEKYLAGRIRLYQIGTDDVATKPKGEIIVPNLRSITSISWLGSNQEPEFLITARRQGMLEIYRYKLGDQPQFLFRRPTGPLWAEAAPNGAWFAMPQTWPGDLSLQLIRQ